MNSHSIINNHYMRSYWFTLNRLPLHLNSRYCMDDVWPSVITFTWDNLNWHSKSRNTYVGDMVYVIFLSQAHQLKAGTCLVFFKINFVWKVSVCVSTPMLLLTSGMIWILYDWLNKLYSFYMATVFGIISRYGFRIKACCRNQPNKTKLVLYKMLLSL